MSRNTIPDTNYFSIMSSALRLHKLNRLFGWLFKIPFLVQTTGCGFHYYYMVTKPDEPAGQALMKYQSEKKYIILHCQSIAWHLTNIVTDEKTVSGTAEMFTGHKKYLATKLKGSTRYIKNPFNNESEIIKEIHIYTKVCYDLPKNQISVPVNSIYRIDEYAPDKGKTTASWIFGGLSLIPLVFIMYLIGGTIALS